MPRTVEAAAGRQGDGDRAGPRCLEELLLLGERGGGILTRGEAENGRKCVQEGRAQAEVWATVVLVQD